MKKITCLVVDDEPMALSLIEGYVLKTPFLELRNKCGNAFEAMESLHNNGNVDLLFLDIQMPDLNGMELSKTLPPETKVIFTTAFDQYALEGYKVNALAYLLKPFDYNEFLVGANKAKSWFELIEKSRQPLISVPEFIFIKSEYKQIKIAISDILYIEGLKDYAKIYLINQPKPILTLMSLKKLDEELPSTKFMRVHRSFIVALDKIEAVERNQIIIHKQRITIAIQYKEIFEKFIGGISL